MCAAIPIVDRTLASVPEAERDRLNGLAEALLSAERRLADTSHFGPDLRPGIGPGPALLIDDQSEIWLAGPPEENLLEYRLAQLGETGDILVLSGRRCKAFEIYLASLLDTGGLDVVVAEISAPRGRSVPMPRRCVKNLAVLGHISEVARAAGGMTIVPHMATGHVWRLAEAIAKASGTTVFVAGSPPGVSRRANNKLWFSEQVGRVLGANALSQTSVAFGPAALAARVRDMSRKVRYVAIKAPDSAGSAGNLVLDTADMKSLSLGALRGRMINLLESIGSARRFPLKVEVWDRPVCATPSVQTWIPEKSDGSPIVEGVFEQIVVGNVGKFVGAVRADLPTACIDRLVGAAMRIALFFQAIGYFGRCSLDAVLVGERPEGADLHWVECNGRWGGVSVAMTFLNRLGPSVADLYPVIIQRSGMKFSPVAFETVLERSRDLLFRPGRSKEGVILLTPAGFESGRGVHLISLAESPDRAQALAEEACTRLIGAPPVRARAGDV